MNTNIHLRITGIIRTICILVSSVPFVASAQTTINVNIPGSNPPSTGPVGIIANFYEFALLVAGLLAFAVIVYAGIKYALAVGNPSKQSDARDHITQALLGLLLLLSAFIILRTINPGLTGLSIAGLDKLEPVEVATSTGAISGRLAQCQGSQCRNSPSVTKVLSCLSLQNVNVRATTYQGTHRENSCHFGGRACTDGSHAIDWGINALGASRITPEQMMTNINQCASTMRVQANCFYEDAGGNRMSSSFGANHIHCNVDNAACGCN